jgi:dienelactone hydrolase
MKLPRPAGPFPIATETLHWIDPQNPDCPEFGILIKLWYPIDAVAADKDALHKARYLGDKLLPYVQQLFKPLPKFLVKRYHKVKTNAYTATPVNQYKPPKNVSISDQINYIPISTTQDKYPIVIFSHGLYGIPDHYTDICENVASNGYVVVAPYHTDGSSVAVVYPNGDEIKFDRLRPNFVSEPIPVDEADQEEDEMMKLAEPKHDFKYRAHQLSLRVNDIKFVLQSLQKIANGANVSVFPPSGHIDINRIGILGHSFGGATVTMSMLTLYQFSDLPQISAAMALDSWLFPLGPLEEFSWESFNPDFVELREKLIRFRDNPRPIAFVNSDSWQWEHNVKRMQFVAQLAGNLGSEESMQGTKHHNFNDIALIMPKLAKLAKKIGTAKPLIQTRELNAIIAKFFDKYLNKLENGTDIIPSIEQLPIQQTELFAV